jgi:hypothetical protein
MDSFPLNSTNDHLSTSNLTCLGKLMWSGKCTPSSPWGRITCHTFCLLN